VTDDNIFVKDLIIFDRKMDNMIIVDNAAYSFTNQLANGVPVLPFYDDK